jgi:hypothetical protein
MKLSAVTLARVLAFVETFDLNPQGTVFFPDLVAKLVEKCRFQKYPQTIQDFDEQKGVEFLAGVWDRVNVEKLTIYNNGILLDTRVSTAISEGILAEALHWAKQFGLTYRPDMIKRWGYVSQLTFYSDVPLLGPGPEAAITKLTSRVSEKVAQRVPDANLNYKPIRLDLDFDRSQIQFPLAPFTIQRRTIAPFSENKYFSEAPLRSEDHIALLEEFEKNIIADALPQVKPLVE